MRKTQRHTAAIRNESSEPLRVDEVRAALEHLLDRYGAPGGEVSVLFSSDDELRRLNRTFRGIDSATDVLSFPAPEGVDGQIGDIAVSVDFARRHAERRGVPIHEEAALLALHGALHLMGYDDGTEEERDDMVRRMNEVAAACGISTDPTWSSLPHGDES
ncbi:MAG: rRNA maturation RNase YbeY [Armatimonadetes bacterium]|nr:rRNA maturation RNase YbeY [Armatimonadota bacterium]